MAVRGANIVIIRQWRPPLKNLPTSLRAFRAWKMCNGQKNDRNWNTRGHRSTNFVSPLKSPPPGLQKFRPPRSPGCLHFVFTVPNTCGPSVWNLFHVIQLAPGTMGWFLEFCNICGPLSQYIPDTLSHFSNFILKYKLRLKFSFSFPAFKTYRFLWYGNLNYHNLSEHIFYVNKTIAPTGVRVLS